MALPVAKIQLMGKRANSHIKAAVNQAGQSVGESRDGRVVGFWRIGRCYLFCMGTSKTFLRTGQPVVPWGLDQRGLRASIFIKQCAVFVAAGRTCFSGGRYLDQSVSVPRSSGCTPEMCASPQCCWFSLGFGRCRYDVTLLGFVGDDELADAVERPLQAAGVVADLLHIKQWQTFTDTTLTSLASAEDAIDVHGRRRRRHKDERALPIDGMSEYEAHLQNRAERYMRNASAVVLVDYDLGSIAEPRALVFVANQLGIPCVAALGNQSRVDQYAKADRQLNVAGLSLADAVGGILPSLPHVMDTTS